MNIATQNKPLSLRCLVAQLTIFLLILSACSSIPVNKPQTPIVELADISLSRLGFKSQEFVVTLDVFNPNRFDLPIRVLDFNVSLDEERVIAGNHTERILLAAESNTQTSVSIETQMNRILSKLLLLSASDVKAMDYTISGFVELENWPTRIPFSEKRTLAKPALKE